MSDEQRTRAFLDSLPEEERERAEYLSRIPASMAVVRVDRDLRDEMSKSLLRLENTIHTSIVTGVQQALKNQPRPKFSNVLKSSLTILGGAIGGAIINALHATR